MSHPDNTLPPTAHMNTALKDEPDVIPILGCPGRYAVLFGHDFDFHVTAEQWARISRIVAEKIEDHEEAIPA